MLKSLLDIKMLSINSSLKNGHFNVFIMINHGLKPVYSLSPSIFESDDIQHQRDPGSHCNKVNQLCSKRCFGQSVGKSWCLFGSVTHNLMISVPLVCWVLCQQCCNILNKPHYLSKTAESQTLTETWKFLKNDSAWTSFTRLDNRVWQGYQHDCTIGCSPWLHMCLR